MQECTATAFFATNDASATSNLFRRCMLEVLLVKIARGDQEGLLRALEETLRIFLEYPQPTPRELSRDLEGLRTLFTPSSWEWLRL